MKKEPLPSVQVLDEDWGILPQPYVTKEAVPVVLEMMEYKVLTPPRKMKIKWTQLEPEILIDASLLSDGNWLYSLKLDVIIQKARAAEDARIRKIDRFLEQMHNADTVQFLKRLLFETQTGLHEISKE